MKKSISLRTQLFALMALLVFLQGFALFIALGVSRVFVMLDAEAFRLFGSTTSSRAAKDNAEIGSLIANLAIQTESVSRRAQNIHQNPSQLYKDDTAYSELAEQSIAPLFSLLHNNAISGAFMMLEGSNANKADAGACSMVYIRNNSLSPSSGTESYQLEVGPIAVAQQHQISTSINWQLDIRPAMESTRYPDYYTKPSSAATQNPGAEIERYGYWAAPHDILGDHQQVVTYTMPLLDKNGVPFGVLGVEISLALFSQHYLPSNEMPYQDSFYAIAPVRDNTIDLDWFIPGGTLPQFHLPQGETLSLTPVSGTDVYASTVANLGKMYCAVKPLTMYSQNSPFYAEEWALLSFVPQNILHETSQSVRSILVFSIVLTTAASLVAIVLLTHFTTRKISGLSKYVRSLSPDVDIQFSRTGIREIDDLTSAVERFNTSASNAAKTTSRILELTLLPIGGFEVSDTSSYVILTEYLYRLFGIESGIRVKRSDWDVLYKELLSHPAPGYDDVYHYMGTAGDTRWLRVQTAPTDTSVVGVVLDVTGDIEERRRLAHELDYDALTHLYNRSAFKREAHLRLQSQPDMLGAMIFADLDNLKYINDTFGHDTGDKLIIRAGEMFRQFEKHGGIVSRISGDEFAIYLHGFSSKDDLRRLIRQQFDDNQAARLQTPDGATQKIRCSAGVAYYPENSANVTDLLKLSDFAMYEAKNNRKGSLFEFSHESYKQNSYLLDNREAINRLLDESLIRFTYHPIVDLHTGEVVAYEALLRPLLDEFKSPLEVLSVASAQSKLGQLERLVLLTAFASIREQVPQLHGRSIFINSIPSQILPDEDLDYLQQNYSDLFPQTVIEIIEAENDYPPQLLRKVDFIRKNGMRLAIDDFGAGYSNEVRILSMQPDIVKVDIDLITHIDQSPDKQKLVSNLISFCHPKGIKLVAEGVERREELATVIQLGLDYVQGFYTGAPSYTLQPTQGRVRREILQLRRQMRLQPDLDND